MNKKYRLFAIAFIFCFCLVGNVFLAKAQVDTNERMIDYPN